MSKNPPTTRLAPSPTGALHLGNARTFLVNWTMARQFGWRVLLRIEDLDGPRVKQAAGPAAVETLRWLGMDWDDEPLYQSVDMDPYRAAMDQLARAGKVYPCAFTRREIATKVAAIEQEAVRQGDTNTNVGGSIQGEARFPASLRPACVPRDFDDDTTAWRFAISPGVVGFYDGCYGPQAFDPSEIVGDFVVWTKEQQPAYQLSVVVDDHRQGVTHIVRGEDLLDSTARQLQLYDALGIGPAPSYTHLPLVTGSDGRKLAKRHGDTRIDSYRDKGVPAERIVGLIAHWCGLCDRPVAMDAAAFTELFALDTMPSAKIVFTKENDQWLLGGA